VLYGIYMIELITTQVKDYRATCNGLVIRALLQRVLQRKRMSRDDYTAMCDTSYSWGVLQ